jgi:hypothetical protein
MCGTFVEGFGGLGLASYTYCSTIDVIASDQQTPIRSRVTISMGMEVRQGKSNRPTTHKVLVTKMSNRMLLIAGSKNSLLTGEKHIRLTSWGVQSCSKYKIHALPMEAGNPLLTLFPNKSLKISHSLCRIFVELKTIALAQK